MNSSRGLKTFPLVLTATQVERLRAIAALRSNEHTRVSVSSVAREVVELGLVEAMRGRHSDNSDFDVSPAREAEGVA